MSEQPKRGVLMGLAAEGIVPVRGGCAGALAGGPEGGLVGGVVGVAVGQAVEKVINFFGARIVQRWGEWLRSQPVEVREQALAELASTPPEEARANRPNRCWTGWCWSRLTRPTVRWLSAT